MRRRRTDPLLQKLRQLIRSGQRGEAMQLLQETLRKQPDNARAREELSRHLTGRPYTFEEKAYAELQEMLSSPLASPLELNKSSGRALRKLKTRIHSLHQQLQHLLSQKDAQNLRQLQQNLIRELNRRRRNSRKPLSVVLGTLLLGLFAGGIYYSLNKRAQEAAEILHRASESKTTSIATATQLLAVHNTGLNRTLERSVRTGAARLQALIRAAKQRSEELDTILKAIESGNQTVVGQGIRRRAEIERMLNLPCFDNKALRQRWAALCQVESTALKQQRFALAEELLSPIPAPQELCGNIESDLNIINQRKELLNTRLLLFEDAGKTLDIPAESMRPLRDELTALNQLQQEITDLRQMLQLLPSAHDYSTYRARLAGMTARHYAPGIELLDILQQMPTEDSVRGMMQEHGQNLRPGLLQASRKSLLEGGPTFSQEFPASREQLQLINELLSNTALRTRLYELTDTAENQLAYSERLPELHYGRARFQRAALDPARQMQQQKTVEWHNPQAILSREIDPRPLYTELGMNNRSGFLSTLNLPDLLTRIFHIKGVHIPALARAYVFHHLVQANAAATEPILSGMRFAPSMRQRIHEFETLRKECGVDLEGSCWLQNSPQHSAAEQKFAHWFNKHRQCDFTDELKRNLGALLGISPHFCGYVNENGQAVLFEEARQGQLIWYMGTDAAMTTTPWGEALQSPMRLSPIFTVERQF